jgi:hypothetical protein
MIHKLPLQCSIPSSTMTNEIQWLEIHQADGGFYLYQSTEQHLPPKWDAFYQNLDDLFGDCKRIWGIQENAWLPIV